VAAAGLFVAAVARRRRFDTATLRSAAASGLGAIAGAAAGTVLWVALASLRTSPAVAESYAYLASILTVGVLVAHWVVGRLGGPRSESRRFGHVTLWVALALVTSIALPGFSYLFVWPALAGTAGLLWHPRRRGWAMLRFTAVAAPTLLLMAPAIDYLFLFAQPRPGNPDSQVTVAALLPLLLGLLVVGLLESRWHRTDTDQSPGPASVVAAS
jgi:hypothetical protein